MTKFIICFLALVLSGMATSCPSLAQASLVPAGCAQQQGPVFANQDCPGATWITSTRTVGYVTNLRGSGCIAHELPSWQNTCLTSNERRTLWYMLEVQPLPGGPTASGAAAGYLRLRITPGDVDGQNLADSGTQFLGGTDYDFALFRVSGQAGRGDACQAIKHATSATEAGSIQSACNYSGLAGPTGMADQGQGISVDDQRYCRPIPVRVGEVYILAIDNFSLNANYFVLDFGVTTTDPARPTALVVPDASQSLSGASTVRSGAACGYGLELSLQDMLPVDSVRGAGFSVSVGTQQMHPTAITPLDQDVLRGTASRYLLMFDRPLMVGTATLTQAGALADRYGRSYGTFTTLLTIRPAATISQHGGSCQGGKIMLTAQRSRGTHFAGWNLGIFPGAVAYQDSAKATVALSSLPGAYPVYYKYLTTDGCLDSAAHTIYVSSLPPTANLNQPTPGVLEASVATLSAVYRYEWLRVDTVFTAPARWAAPAGAYQVRAVDGACPGLWSDEVIVAASAVTSTQAQTRPTLHLYPNPAQDIVTLQAAGVSTGRIVVEITSVAGQVVFSRSYPNPDWQRQISLAGLPAGIYHVSASAGGVTLRERLVIE